MRNYFNLDKRTECKMIRFTFHFFLFFFFFNLDKIWTPLNSMINQSHPRVIFDAQNDHRFQRTSFYRRISSSRMGHDELWILHGSGKKMFSTQHRLITYSLPYFSLSLRTDEIIYHDALIVFHSVFPWRERSKATK